MNNDFGENAVSEKKPTSKRILTLAIWIVVAVALALGAFFLTNNFLMRWPIAGSSMHPTLNDGDDVLLLKTKNVNYDDIIIFYDATMDKNLIKRVIGKENDVITTKLAPNGNGYQIFRNGKLLSEEFTNGPMTRAGGFKASTVTVPKGKLYVLGDNRNVSYDSSEGLFVEIDKIVGIAFLRIGDGIEFI